MWNDEKKLRDLKWNKIKEICLKGINKHVGNKVNYICFLRSSSNLGFFIKKITKYFYKLKIIYVFRKIL